MSNNLNNSQDFKFSHTHQDNEEIPENNDIYCIDTYIDTHEPLDDIFSHDITNCHFFNEQLIDKHKVKKCQICEDLGNVEYVNTHHTNKCFDKSQCILINGIYHLVDDYYGIDDDEAEMRCYMSDENTEKDDDEHDYDY